MFINIKLIFSSIKSYSIQTISIDITFYILRVLSNKSIGLIDYTFYNRLMISWIRVFFINQISIDTERLDFSRALIFKGKADPSDYMIFHHALYNKFNSNFGYLARFFP